MITFDPPVIAHRGASGYAPENTMTAFTRAVSLGIKWVEFDVMLAQCGTPVIYHDETLLRTTQHQGSISDYPYQYLRTLDAGKWFNPINAGEHIPTLRELMEFIVATGLSANIEIKPMPGLEEQTVKNTLQITREFFPDHTDKLLFSSFCLHTLRFLRQQSPSCQMAILMHEWHIDWLQNANNLQCISIDVNEHILSEENVRLIKNAGKLLLSYTVNEPARAGQLFSWGVDAVFSDFPDRIARFAF